MLPIDIRDHRNGGRQSKERPVTFISLGNEQVTSPQPGVGPHGIHLPPHHKRRIEAGMRQHRRDNGRRRGFPVSPGNRHAEFESHEFRQHFGSWDHRHDSLFRSHHFRIRRLNG